MVILPHVLGSITPILGPVTSYASLAEATELLVAFGGVPAKNMAIDSGGAVHTSVDWLHEIRARGAEFVNVSPIRTDMEPELDAQWLPIRPNTDTALMLALAHTLYAEELLDQAFLDRYSVGFERFTPYLTGELDGVPKDADWAAPVTEIPAETIRALARRMAASRTMINVSWSVQRADHGEQPYWMAAVLAAMLGQVGLPGGGITYGYGATGNAGTPSLGLAQPSLTPTRNPVDTAIPCARIADMLEDPGGTYRFNGETRTYPDIRLVYWAGGNPFHHHQDLNRLRRAWARPETIVIQDPWWTPAARMADIVLPAATQLERNDIGSSRSQRHVYFMEQAIPPVGGARTDYHILTGIAQRLGLKDVFTEERDEAAWLRHIYDLWRQRVAEKGVETPGFDAFREAEYLEIPAPEIPYFLFADFRADPQAHPLGTPSGKIEIFSEAIAGFRLADCPGHPVWLEPVEWLGAEAARTHPLHMISNQPRWRLHSQADPGSVSRAHKVAGREPALLNPADAAARGIKPGDVVRVFNERGSCLAGAEVSDEVRPGVLQLTTGAWYDPLEPGPADSLDKHGNPNLLTRDAPTSELGQGPVAQSTLVEVEVFAGEAPPVTVFHAPEVGG
jgi:biotin/methionine sulfoxide reductase